MCWFRTEVVSRLSVMALAATLALPSLSAAQDDEDLELDLSLPPVDEAPAPAAKPPAEKGEPAPSEPEAEAEAAPEEGKGDEEEPAKIPDHRLRLSPAIGFGNTAETQGLGGASTFNVGAAVAFAFTTVHGLELDYRHQFYERSYLTGRPGAGEVVFDEQKIDVDLLYSFDVMALLGIESWSAAVLAGPSFRIFHNDALRSQAGTIVLGGRGRFDISDTLDVSGSALWGWNFFFKNADLLSALGGPLHVSSFDAGFGLKLAPQTRLRLGYQGEILTLKSSYRFFHSLAFTFDVSI